jgi:Tol biopolymer transport system component
VWVDRHGAATPLAESRRDLYVFPRLSPDGRQALVRFEGPSDCYLNTLDLGRGAWSRLTFQGDSHAAAWSPDGKRVAFESKRASGSLLLVVPVGGGAEETVYVGEHRPGPLTWSPDGRNLAFEEENARTGWDIEVMRPASGSRPRPFLETPFAERAPEFSPDGSWIAYQSDESGSLEVYVRPFPGPGPKHVISVGGGAAPRWAEGGQELFYRAGRAIMAVAIGTRHGFVAGTPRRLFEGDYKPDGGYDVTADGQRFLMLRSHATPASSQIQVVLDWFDELRARARTK